MTWISALYPGAYAEFFYSVLFSPFISATMVQQALLYECRGFRNTFFPTKGYPFVVLVRYKRGTITLLSYPCRMVYRAFIYLWGFCTSFEVVWLSRALV